MADSQNDNHFKSHPGSESTLKTLMWLKPLWEHVRHAKTKHSGKMGST